MTGDPMGDEVYQPQSEEQADSAPLDLEDALGERDYDEVLNEGYSPPEKPLGVEKHGITASEQREGESLDQRLAQEVPDAHPDARRDEVGDLPGGEGEPVDPESGEQRSGRLVAPDEGAHADRDKDMVARDVGVDAGAAGAEEAALHVVPDEDLES